MRIGLCFVLALAAAPAPAETLLADAIRAVTNRPEYKHGRWGIVVADAATGETLFEQNPDQMFVPASTTKLYSCSTALAELGPDYRFRTPVYRRGEVRNGVLVGDLILVASGDLTFGGRTDGEGNVRFTDSDHTYADTTSTTHAVTPTDPLGGLRDLARKVKGAGISSVNGDILIDDRLFDRGSSSGSGPGLVTPVLVNDNVVDVLVEPASEAGHLARVSIRPETAFVQFDSDVKTTAKGSVNVAIVPAGPRKFAVRGRIAVGTKPVVRIYSVDDPAAFARAAFIETLRAEGVGVDASLFSQTATLPGREDVTKLPLVAEHQSAPLSAAITVTLKVSHNLYASTLPALIAAHKGQRTVEAGLKIERAYLKSLGVDLGSVTFAGGAGGAQADSTTPRATAMLLKGLQGRPEYPALEAGLPILGVDGTLADTVDKSAPGYGKVRAKTGTLSYTDVLNGGRMLRSKALAGATATASGRKVVFAVMVNDVPLPPGVTTSREGRALGQIASAIYEHAK